MSAVHAGTRCSWGLHEADLLFLGRRHFPTALKSQGWKRRVSTMAVGSDFGFPRNCFSVSSSLTSRTTPDELLQLSQPQSSHLHNGDNTGMGKYNCKATFVQPCMVLRSYIFAKIQLDYAD
uniref:Uncharacterized protein n=1 Tax=Molossus molossus TaxID=27622 RepID=A0A7J8DTX7_MOLMO|nr:hypothetical protein HJG59_009143 [Molossus molossus]